MCAAFAAAPRVSTAQPAAEDAPVPGGVVEFARAVGIRPPVPDRARFLYDVTRLVYETENRPPVVPAVLQTLGRGDARLKARAPDAPGDGPGTDDEGPRGFSRPHDEDLVPVPLTP